ncbi:hypothetical protein OS493_018513 [Desmophyllum pertusum]|uniref:SET domain-containing protein n=1 Tax=Desmophyllum pertusum TaxID=174260 RepID=A0A9X0D9H2_9CNID|nr:hypothetical protein OS493_018513 [Desmophyllum pertusum]
MEGVHKETNKRPGTSNEQSTNDDDDETLPESEENDDNDETLLDSEEGGHPKRTCTRQDSGEDEAESSGTLHDVPSDPRGAGICAFAARDIKKSEIICEYKGEVISLEEAKRRENLYREQGKACTLMVLESKGRQIV